MTVADMELEVHHLSLSHHIKLEALAPTSHHCPSCNKTCASLGEYSKHVDTLEHRKKRDRLRAIIDTMDAGENVEHRISSNRDHRQMLPTPDCEAHMSFVRNGNHRKTYPMLCCDGRQQRMQSQYKEHSVRFRKDQQRKVEDGFYWSVNHNNRDPNRVDRELAWNKHLAATYARPELNMQCSQEHGVRSRVGKYSAQDEGTHRLRFPDDVQGVETFEGRVQDDHSSVDVLYSSLSSSNTDSTIDNYTSPLPKRGILARLSFRGKNKVTNGSNTAAKKSDKIDKKDKKGKKKKTVASINTTSPFKHAGPLNVSMKDKSKKWELVAVKGKASYLRNRSQRLLKDRMTKYRLVDDKGVVVEGHESEPSTSAGASARMSDHTCNSVTDAKIRSQQKEKSMTNSPASSPNTSRTPSTLCPSQYLDNQDIEVVDYDDSSSGYATLGGELPTSTSGNLYRAVRADKNCQGLSVDGRDKRDVQNSISHDRSAEVQYPANCLPVSSNSLAVDSPSHASPIELTTLPNVTQGPEIVMLKEEPVEVAHPDVLPSPPQLDQTISPNKDGTEKGVGEKERQEFWELGLAEMKKGQEIVETRARIEGLQRQLFEATAALHQMEIEMNEILRRKSELLGLPIPSSS